MEIFKYVRELLTVRHTDSLSSRESMVGAWAKEKNWALVIWPKFSALTLVRGRCQ
jgi:hypothetical protein